MTRTVYLCGRDHEISLEDLSEIQRLNSRFDQLDRESHRAAEAARIRPDDATRLQAARTAARATTRARQAIYDAKAAIAARSPITR